LRRAKDEAPAPTVIDEKAMAGIDMELKDEAAAHAEDFHSEETPNIWALPDDENVATADEQPDEDELDKPSFLRRLTGRGGKAADLDHFGEDVEEPDLIIADNTNNAAAADDSNSDENDKPDDNQTDEESAESDEKPAKSDKKSKK